MLTCLPVPAGVLTFGQFIKKPCLEYRADVSRLPVRRALGTEHFKSAHNHLLAAT